MTKEAGKTFAKGVFEKIVEMGFRPGHVKEIFKKAGPGRALLAIKYGQYLFENAGKNGIPSRDTIVALFFNRPPFGKDRMEAVMKGLGIPTPKEVLGKEADDGLSSTFFRIVLGGGAVVHFLHSLENNAY